MTNRLFLSCVDILNLIDLQNYSFKLTEKLDENLALTFRKIHERPDEYLSNLEFLTNEIYVVLIYSNDAEINKKYFRDLYVRYPDNYEEFNPNRRFYKSKQLLNKINRFTNGDPLFNFFNTKENEIIELLKNTRILLL